MRAAGPRGRVGRVAGREERRKGHGPTGSAGLGRKERRKRRAAQGEGKGLNIFGFSKKNIQFKSQ